MSSHEDGRNGFRKGNQGVVGENDFYAGKGGLVHVPASKQLFVQKTLSGQYIKTEVVDAAIENSNRRGEPAEVTISAEGFRKLLYPYGRMLGINDDVMEGILEDPSASNGDVVMARVKHEYARVCKARGGHIPRGYEG